MNIERKGSFVMLRDQTWRLLFLASDVHSVEYFVSSNRIGGGGDTEGHLSVVLRDRDKALSFTGSEDQLLLDYEALQAALVVDNGPYR